MCLISRTNKPLIAEKDIVCYKLLRRCGFLYRTPITHTIVFPFWWKLFNISFTAKCDEEILKELDSSCYYISKGFIHTFKSKCIYPNGCVMFKCVIPKGTEYFVDSYNPGYASKQIKFIKKI